MVNPNVSEIMEVLIRFTRLSTNKQCQIQKEAIKLNVNLYYAHNPELIPAGLKLIKRSKKDFN